MCVCVLLERALAPQRPSAHKKTTHLSGLIIIPSVTISPRTTFSARALIILNSTFNPLLYKLWLYSFLKSYVLLCCIDARLCIGPVVLVCSRAGHMSPPGSMGVPSLWSKLSLNQPHVPSYLPLNFHIFCNKQWVYLKDACDLRSLMSQMLEFISPQQ